MKIVEFTAELHGNREVTLNGRNLRDSEPLIEEKVIFNKMTLDQQWQLLSMLNKLQSKLNDTYRRSRVKAGELTQDGKVRSGATGVRDANLGRL